MSAAEGSRVEWVSRDEVLTQWNTLFDKHPWLEGLACEGTCGDVLCCPPRDVPDSQPLSRATGLLFLGAGTTSAPTLSRDLLRPTDGVPTELLPARWRASAPRGDANGS